MSEVEYFELVGRRARRAVEARLLDGAYTTIRTYDEGAKVLRLAGHLERLVESGRHLGRSGSLDLPDVASALLDALRQRAAPGDVRIRLSYAPPRLLAELTPFVPLPESLRRQGVACAVVSLRRRDPACKETRFAVAAQRAAAELPPGVHEGLMVDERGAILEGLSSNFFALHEGRLRTEGERALPGVTRGLVLEIAPSRVDVELRPLMLTELPAAAECFLTSTSRGILPVVRVDDEVVADGRPGALTLALMRQLDERIAAESQRLTALSLPPGRS